MNSSFQTSQILSHLSFVSWKVSRSILIWSSFQNSSLFVVLKNESITTFKITFIYFKINWHVSYDKCSLTQSLDWNFYIIKIDIVSRTLNWTFFFSHDYLKNYVTWKFYHSNKTWEINTFVYNLISFYFFCNHYDWIEYLYFDHNREIVQKNTFTMFSFEFQRINMCDIQFEKAIIFVEIYFF